MPFAHPVVDIELIDYDQGDEQGPDGVAQRISDYVSTRLLALRFSDHLRKRDQLELTLRNDDFELFAYPAFTKGQKLNVTWGWPGRMAAPRRVVVRSVKGGDTVTVKAYCVSTLLDLRKRARFRAGVTDSEYVRAIAAEHGYTGTLAHIEATTVRRDITQGRWMTDARMLRRLAVRNGFEFYLDATGLHWHRRPTDRPPVRILHYRTDPGQGSIIGTPQFDNVDLSGGTARVRVMAYDPITKEVVDESVGIADEENVSLGHDDELYDPEDADIGLRGARVSTEEVFTGGLLTAAEARVFASGRYREVAAKRYKGRMTIIGDPLIMAKQVVGVFGIQEVVDGLYFVREAVSSITPGSYTTELRLERDAVPKVTAAKKRQPRANTNEAEEKPEWWQPQPGEDWTWFEPKLERMITGLVDPDGRVVPGYIYGDTEGYTGQTSRMTWEEFEALSERQRRDLYEQGVNTAYPDP